MNIFEWIESAGASLELQTSSITGSAMMRVSPARPSHPVDIQRIFADHFKVLVQRELPRSNVRGLCPNAFGVNPGEVWLLCPGHEASGARFLIDLLKRPHEELLSVGPKADA